MSARLKIGGFFRSSGINSLPTILPKKKKNIRTVASNFPASQKPSMWKWRPLGCRTTLCIQFIMLLRDKGENVGAKIEIGSKRKKTGPKETLGTYSFDSTSVLAFFFLVELV